MTTIDRLAVEFGADFKTLLAEFKAAERASGEFRTKVERELTGARAEFDKLATGVRSAIAGALATLKGTAITAGIALLASAFSELHGSIDKARIAQEAANKLQEQGRKIAEDLATATAELAEQKKVEALATIALTESEITRLQTQRDALSKQLRPAGPGNTAGKFRNAELESNIAAIDETIAKIKEQIGLTRLSIKAGEESAAIAAGMRTTRSGSTDKPAAASGAVAPRSGGEAELLREAQAAMKAGEALDEYRRRTADMLEASNAELVGKRELVLAIELEGEARRRGGLVFAEVNRERIAEYAAERAQIERQIEFHRRLMSEAEQAGGTIKNALGDSVVALLDQTGNAAEKMRAIWANAMADMSRRLLNFAMDAAWAEIMRNIGKIGFSAGIGGGADPTAGGGGIAGFIGAALGSLLEGIGKRASGGPVMAGMPYIVGEKRPELFVPNVNGTIVPRVPGGGMVTFYGTDSDKVEIGQLKAGLSQLGIQYRQLNASIESRSVAANADFRRRLS